MIIIIINQSYINSNFHEKIIVSLLLTFLVSIDAHVSNDMLLLLLLLYCLTNWLSNKQRCLHLKQEIIHDFFSKCLIIM